MKENTTDLITKKEGYEAMLYLLKNFYENTGSNDLTDILSGGEYWPEGNQPVDSAFAEYWEEAIIQVRNEGPLFKKFI